MGGRIIDTTLEKESLDRYLTYALSVVSSRALPDVRDGLKPVQRRILYDMFSFLSLTPDKGYKKSAAVVGGVLARFHPHGDTACYDALVRMAQDFACRYPLIDGQGNFGSIDGDSAAAYRYTEVKLTSFAVDVVGEIHEETVAFRDNFDGTHREPVVLPSKVPNLLVNGCMGIAVGMATNIPPHNLRDVTKALRELINNPKVSDSRLASLIKGPDFPTGCDIVNSASELKEIYATGRGSIKMRGGWKLEEGARGKKFIVITSVPYAQDKSQLVEKIAQSIIAKKVPQLVDVRDESTDEVRIVLELSPKANPEHAIAYLYKNTQLEMNFSVNMTALVPQNGTLTCRPERLSLKGLLQHFLTFREEVTRKRLEFELKNLKKRVHILEGLVKALNAVSEIIRIVRRSEGRKDAADKLRARFKFSQEQSYAIVDMKIYQLSKTSVDDIKRELREKKKRIKEIETVLKSKKGVLHLVEKDIEAIARKHGDKRKSRILKSDTVTEFDESAYIVMEEVYVIITKDGWLKRIRQGNDPKGTRIREGDKIAKVHALTTLDSLALFTSQGYLYSLKVSDIPSSSGYGMPVQKLLRFRDEERIIQSYAVWVDDREGLQRELFSDNKGVLAEGDDLLMVSSDGMGAKMRMEEVTTPKRTGRRVMKLRSGSELVSVCHKERYLAVFTKEKKGMIVDAGEIPLREGASLGVKVISLDSGNTVIGACALSSLKGSVEIMLSSGKRAKIAVGDIARRKRGSKGAAVIRRGSIVGCICDG
ncbi:MAG: DNA topoisomerase 4 subunit A [Candidatus Dadabacteria bacterium]|nr:MAG: DNA topoisomerase 4 subunit A [Candidatus Dadabacteria bacterium]